MKSYFFFISLLGVVMKKPAEQHSHSIKVSTPAIHFKVTILDKMLEMKEIAFHRS
jgi:hypothetical protein